MDPEAGTSLVDLMLAVSVVLVMLAGTLTGVAYHQRQRRITMERQLAMVACRNTLEQLRAVDIGTLPASSSAARRMPMETRVRIPTGGFSLGEHGGVMLAVLTVLMSEVRVKALELLDRSGCSDSDRIQAVTLGLPSEGLYWAARCLVRGNDPVGVRMLLDLAASEADDAESARLLARVALEELSGIPSARGVDAWRTWGFGLGSDAGGLRPLSATPR